MISIGCLAKDYHGLVVDQSGEPISYATVYPEANPVLGTATNNEGFFSLNIDLPSESSIVISFIGYEKQILPLSYFAKPTPGKVELHEQPIALQETVVAAKPNRQRNKRKQMAHLLYLVLQQMQRDFSDQPTRYHIVSDVRMDADSQVWGIEQMIATAVVLPDAKNDATDSVQFSGEYCKRFFKPEIRALADTIYKGQAMEHIDKRMRRAATAIDSGVVVHRELFRVGNICDDFQKNCNDLRHWQVSNESENETVLSHTEKHNYGIAKYTLVRHYIVDSRTYAVRRFSEQGTIQLFVPFGKKLNADQLQLLNLLNMNEQQIEQFRLRRINAQMSLNTIYQLKQGKRYLQEKNMHLKANIMGSHKATIPLDIQATQRVVKMQTQGVKPMSRSQMRNRIPREIVEIY